MFWNGDNYFTLLADRTGWTRGVAKCQQVKSKQREALSVSFGKGIAFDQEFVPVSRPQSGRTVLQDKIKVATRYDGLAANYLAFIVAPHQSSP